MNNIKNASTDPITTVSVECIGVKPPEGNSGQSFIHTPIMQKHFYYIIIKQTTHISFIPKLISP